MKKFFIGSLFLMLVHLGVAQEFYGGVLAGFNGSQLDGDGSRGFNKLGLTAGVWTQRDITPQFYWGMELKMNQKGSRKLINKYDNWHYVYRLNYIELPMMVGYHYKDYISFFAGASYGYLFNKNGWSTDGPDPTVLYDDVSNWEMAYLLGIKVDFQRLVKKQWAQNFMLETRYQYSLFSIDEKHDFFTYYLTIGNYNSVISTVLYYRVDWPGQ